MTGNGAKKTQNAHIIVFDGVCIFCNRLMRWIVSRDPGRKFSFAQVQSQTGTALFERYGLDPDRISTLLLIADDQAYEKSDAIIRIAAELDGFWKNLRFLRLVPWPLRDFGYTVFARNRYRWFGRTADCMIPDDELRGRFID